VLYTNSTVRGFTDYVAEDGRTTAAQKVAQLELMLGQIANYRPIIARNTIVKKTLLASVAYGKL